MSGLKRVFVGGVFSHNDAVAVLVLDPFVSFGDEVERELLAATGERMALPVL